MQSTSPRSSGFQSASSSPTSRKRRRSTGAPSSKTSAIHPVQILTTHESQVHVDCKGGSKQSHITKRRQSQDTTPSLNAMYTFSSRPSGDGNVIVDLTASPSTSSDRSASGSMRQSAGLGLNSHTGAKKLVVKNLKANTQWDSRAYLEKTWDQLDRALGIIFQNDQNHISREDLYRGVENVCRQGGASTLYTRLENRCRAHVGKAIREPLLQACSNQSSVQSLKSVISSWKLWKAQLTTIHEIFFFMDRSYLLSSNKLTLAELTPQLFRVNIFEHPVLKERIIQGACDLVADNRSHQSTSEEKVFEKAIEMFNELTVYTSSFEPCFLAESQQYFDLWSRDTSSRKALPDYVKESEQCISMELERCNYFGLPASTRRDLLSSLEQHLVVSRQIYLTDYDALASMLSNNSLKDLAALYALLQRRRLGDKLRPAFQKWVDQTGTSIVFATTTDDMIVHLLSLQRRLDNVWRIAFQRDESLGHGLRETFETFMNKTKKGDATWGTDNTKVGEMIAKYVDALLRGGAKAIPEVLTTRRSSSITEVPAQVMEQLQEDDKLDEDTEIDSQLDQVLDLFRFVHGKAVFEAFYKKDLAKRLLLSRSASSDAERSMLTRLKTECGSGFTQNLEQMFKDIELAREEMLSYKQRLEDRLGYEKGKDIDLGVNILSAAAWPTYPDIPVVVPANVKKAINDFELHYKSKHTGRKLDWKHALAHCQMRANFNQGNKELVVSSFQAVVLLLFNSVSEGESLPYSHILSETGLPEGEAKRTLQSLACAKLRPLTKHPKGRDINSTDTFTVNLDFTHPKYRVKVNQVQLKETKEENKETHIRVAEDRNFECQAAIVRIMKSRKTIGHSELVSEVIKATMSRGVLAVGDIKKNIDRLIEKDYMEREDSGGYSYVA